MADHSVGTRDGFHESEASEASVFCFDNASLMYAKKGITKKGISKFISPDVSVIYLFANLRVFLVGLGNLGKFLSFFIEVSEEIWRKIKYLLR